MRNHHLFLLKVLHSSPNLLIYGLANTLRAYNALSPSLPSSTTNSGTGHAFLVPQLYSIYPAV